MSNLLCFQFQLCYQRALFFCYFYLSDTCMSGQGSYPAISFRSLVCVSEACRAQHSPHHWAHINLYQRELHKHHLHQPVEFHFPPVQPQSHRKHLASWNLPFRNRGRPGHVSALAVTKPWRWLVIQTELCCALRATVTPLPLPLQILYSV